ncbi:MAG: beta-ketoacyl-[acyl-carrier-protein] synthase family protein [Pontiellaceae bacterium]|nr:beta-ketoacyl-[acyl-carrier-protein] synthase family protein [Pontiellaceae bacterium]
MISSDSNRVVVTGMGIVSPCGIGIDPYWDALINCKSGIGPITRFDASDFPVKIAGEVKNFDMRDYFGPKCRPHRYSLQTQFGLVACQQALNQAGLTPEMLKKEEVVPVMLGVASGANHLIEHNAKVLAEKGAHKMPLNVRAFPPAATAGAIAQVFGFQVSPTTISSCCPSGLDAICEAVKHIRSGRSDLVLAGAVDSYVTPVTVASFYAINLTSPSTDYPPEQVCRPFDKNRSGVVFSEGSGILVLERLDSALARGATPLLEIISGSRFTDSADGEPLDGMAKSMAGVLNEAGIYPNQVDYICSNSQGHPEMDALEIKMIKRIFKSHAYQIPVTSIRGVLGHALASAGIMQVIACALMIKNSLIPPTANLTEPDPKCDLDHVPGAPRKSNFNTAIINSHGMAAENSTLLVSRVK